MRDLVVDYGGTVVLARLDLEGAVGESVAITGPSGSGKSTLLGCVMGTVRPTSGVDQVEESVVSGLDAAARAQLRRRFMGLIF